MNKGNILIKELQNLCHDYQYLKEMIDNIETQNLGVQKIYSSLKEMKRLKLDIGTLDIKLEKFLEKLIEEEEYLIETIEQRQKIQQRIQHIEQPHRNILFFRYICGKTFEEIAGKMNYSTKRIYQLHKESLYIYCEKFQ